MTPKQLIAVRPRPLHQSECHDALCSQALDTLAFNHGVRMQLATLHDVVG